MACRWYPRRRQRGERGERRNPRAGVNCQVHACGQSTFKKLLRIEDAAYLQSLAILRMFSGVGRQK